MTIMIERSMKEFSLLIVFMLMILIVVLLSWKEILIQVDIMKLVHMVVTMDIEMIGIATFTGTIPVTIEHTMVTGMEVITGTTTPTPAKGKQKTRTEIKKEKKLGARFSGNNDNSYELDFKKINGPASCGVLLI